MNIALLVFLVFVVVAWIGFQLFQKRQAARNRGTLQEFLRAVAKITEEESIKGSKVLAIWSRGYPKAVLLFPSEADMSSARNSGATDRVAARIASLVQSSPAYGFNRHKYSKEQSLLLSLTPPVTGQLPEDRFWWEHDLVGDNAIPLGPEIQDLVDHLIQAGKRAEAATLLVTRCGANIPLPWCETVPEVEEAVRFKRFAVLFRSGGDVEKLAKLIWLVSEDYRELPGWGEIGRKYKLWLQRRELS